MLTVEAEAEADACLYKLKGNRLAIPATAFKAAMVGACRFFEKPSMVEAKQMFFVVGEVDDAGRDTVVVGHRDVVDDGRAALMLSGGGAWGHFHIGVVKALLESNLLPNVISGSSAGSLVTAVLGTHTDEQLFWQSSLEPLRQVAPQLFSLVQRSVWT